MPSLSLWGVLASLLVLAMTAGTVQAQVPVPQAQRQRLQTLADQFRIDERAEQARTERLAREHGLQLLEVRPDGRLVLLDHFDEDGRPVYMASHMTEARATIGVDRVQPGGDTGLSLTGEGITLGMWEIGAGRGSHQEFQGRFHQRDRDFGTAGHATHVGGMMIAGGVDARALGMSYRAELDAYDTNNSNSEMSDAAADGLQISNHSYGLVGGWSGSGACEDGVERRRWHGDPSVSEDEDWRFGFYNRKAERWDRIAFNAPYYLIVNSGGNDRGDQGPAEHCVNVGGTWRVVNRERPPDGGEDGYDSVSDAVVSKNVLGIGSIQDIPDGYEQPSDVRMSGYSGWGPTDDGRVKPDLVANGTGVFNANADGDDTYARLGGTSMAAPSVAGAIGLLLEHHRNLNGVDAPLMRAATIKGLLIHTANEAGHPGPDYVYGWGLTNIVGAAELMSEDALFDGHLLQEHTLHQEDTIRVPLDVVDSDGPLQVTISWTDPPGNPPDRQLDPRTPMLVNDLDLVIEGPNATLHYPWTLDLDRPALPAVPGDNVVDNIEQVVIRNPTSGRYVARITHKSLLNGLRQDVSLILDRAPGERHSASGRITLESDPSKGGGGVKLQLAGFTERTIRSEPDGTYSFDGLYDGEYTVTPALESATFTPEQHDVTIEGGDVTGLDFVAATEGVRNITLRLNTATLPDTLEADDLVQVRGCLVGCEGESSILPDGRQLAWDSRSTVDMTHVGGDYWEVTMQVPEGDSLDFKFVAQVEGGEEILEGGPVNRLEAGIGHLTLPLHYFEAGEDQPYEWRPWTRPGEVEDDWVAVHYRFLLPSDAFAIVPTVLGDDLGGEGPLRWDQSRLKLDPESEEEGTAASRLYSGTVFYPPSLQGEEQAYRFALFIQERVEGTERAFTIPETDTTLQWVPFGNALPLAADDDVGTEEDVPVVIDVLANDRDLDGDSLFVASVGPAQNGQTQLTSEGRVRYAPDQDFDSNDTFTYTVRDAAGFEAQATVSVDVDAVNDAPTAPALTQPGAQATVLVEDEGWMPFEVTWRSSFDPDDSRLSYTWQLARTDAFDDVVLHEETGSDTTLAISKDRFDRLLDSLAVSVGGSMMLHHRTRVDDGVFTAHSDTLTLTLERGVVTAVKGGEVPARFEVGAPYPNPARDASTLRYALPEPASVEVDVIDALGRRVQALSFQRQPAGRHTLRLDLRDLPGGVYLCRVRAGDHHDTHTMVVVR